jgi:hypothetical protein
MALGEGEACRPRRMQRRERVMVAVVRSTLSAKAQRLGLENREDVEKEFVEAKAGWSKGTEYHCPFCDKEFWSPSGARKHMKTQAHPVLRWDWY